MYELVYKHFNAYNNDWDEVFIRSENKQDCLDVVNKYNIKLQDNYDESYGGFCIKEIKPKPIKLSKSKEKDLIFLIQKEEKERQRLEELRNLKLFDFDINQLVNIKVDK